MLYRILLFGLLLVSTVSMAQTYPITDRSLAYATAYTIPQQSLQLEGGYFDVYDLGKDASASIAGFQTLLRYGVSAQTELRAGMAYNSLALGPERFTGLSALRLGMKTKLVDEGQIMPSLSFLAEVSLPDIGSVDFTPERITPAMRVIAEKYINDIFILGTNLGWSWSPVEPEFTYVVTLRTAITDHIAFYTEYYGRNSKLQGPADFFDVALEFWVLDRVALDIAIGWGVTDSSDGGFLSIGGGVFFE